MRVLLWRAWSPQYSFPATYSSVAEYSIGGTCSQLLLHAQALTNMGCTVQVMGASGVGCFEEGVEFVGGSNQQEQLQVLTSGKVRPDCIFLEGGFSAAPLLRSLYPAVPIIHVGQNIDDRSGDGALREKSITAYAFVSPGHLAKYCARYPHLRHRFLLLRNVVPWRSIYSDLKATVARRRIAWIGAWTKLGLRRWAKTISRVLAEDPNCSWYLYGPNHGSHIKDHLPSVLAGVALPQDQIFVQSLPLCRLAPSIAEAQVVVVSLGNETACISALDAHAAGRPVLSGDDLIFKYNNPEVAGFRVSSDSERYRAIMTLLDNPELSDQMGRNGRTLVENDYTERNQESDLRVILEYIALGDTLRDHFTTPTNTDRFRRKSDEFFERLSIKWFSLASTSRLVHPR